MKNNTYFQSRMKGFTLMEVLVSMFIFSLMMASVAQIFVTAFSGYRSTRAVQRDIDNAQYALNIMAKELRTSTIVNPAAGALVARTDIQFYDYSQSKCFRYRIAGGNLQVASAADPDIAACTARVLDPTTISTGVVTGTFRVTPSDSSPAHVGKVTVSLDISEGSAHHARIQTSVSLRDFGNIGL